MDPYGWDVKANQELLAFLRPYEAWRAEGIIRCGLVTVQHTNGAREKTRDPKFKLLKGEKVFIPIGGVIRDVLMPPGCRAEMEQDATKRVRNFVFQGGLTAFETTMTTVLLRAHPNMTRIDDPGDDLETLIMKLKNYDMAPIGTIQIVAHGSTRGNVNMKLRRQRPAKDDSVITYEGLEEAVKEITTIKAYPPLFLKPRPIDPDTKKPMPASVRIRACRIGVHEKFLRKFKQALGPGIDAVSGSRFLQDAGPVGSSGWIEFLRYEFMVLSPRVLTRKELIQAFQGGDLAFAPGPPTYFDKRPVPPRAWDAWIPKSLVPTSGEFDRLPDKLKIIVPLAKNPLREKLPVYFRWKAYTLQRFRRTMTNEKPSSPDDALAKLPAHVNALGPSQPWSDGHPFPLSERLGYKDLAAMVQGFTWKVEEVSGKKYAFEFEGTRQEYSVMLPLMQGTQDLICNFYSLDPALPSLQMYREDDPKFFTTV